MPCCCSSCMHGHDAREAYDAPHGSMSLGWGLSSLASSGA